jgi:hypothetical protein
MFNRRGAETQRDVLDCYPFTSFDYNVSSITNQYTTSFSASLRLCGELIFSKYGLCRIEADITIPAAINL